MNIENSPVYASPSNGIVERAIQAVQGQVRVLKFAAEERLQVELAVGHAIWPWLIEHAAFLLNRGEVGHDGKTAYTRLFGKPNKGAGNEFGERVHYKWRVDTSLRARWEDGIWLGRRWGTMTHIVAVSADEVVEVRGWRAGPSWRDGTGRSFRL